EPLVVRLRILALEALPPPRVAFELRSAEGDLLAAGEQETASLGWERGPGEQELRLDLERLPVADGRFRLRFGLLAGSSDHHYHWLDDAVELTVYPATAG